MDDNQQGATRAPAKPETTLKDLLEVVIVRIEHGRFADGWDIEMSKWLAMLEDWQKCGASPDPRQLETARRLLDTHWPNLGILQDLRQRMTLDLWLIRNNLTGKLVRWTGGGRAIPCALFGLFAAILLTSIGAVVWFGWLAAKAAPEGMVFFRQDEIAPVIFSAMLGAIAGQFLRINEFGQLRAYHPLLVMLNSLLKPLTTIILAIAVVALLKIGLVKIGSIDFAKGDDLGKYALWFVGFLCGFSERLAPDLIRRAEDAAAPPTKTTKGR
jgi:hypothetical protein